MTRWLYEDMWSSIGKNNSAENKEERKCDETNAIYHHCCKHPVRSLSVHHFLELRIYGLCQQTIEFAAGLRKNYFRVTSQALTAAVQLAIPSYRQMLNSGSQIQLTGRAAGNNTVTQWTSGRDGTGFSKGDLRRHPRVSVQWCVRGAATRTVKEERARRVH